MKIGVFDWNEVHEYRMATVTACADTITKKDKKLEATGCAIKEIAIYDVTEWYDHKGKIQRTKKLVEIVNGNVPIRSMEMYGGKIKR